MFKIKRPVFRSPQRSDSDCKDNKRDLVDGMSSLERQNKSLDRDGKPRVKVSECVRNAAKLI